MNNLSLSLTHIFLATSRFCEAILEFLADQKRASGANIRAEDFEGEAYSIYELFSTVWLQSKEAKVPVDILCFVCDASHPLDSTITAYNVVTSSHAHKFFIFL